MIQALLHNFFQIVRSVFNFAAPTKNARNMDEICRHLEMLQIDSSNAETVSAAYIYLIDPHKLPISNKNANANTNKKEFNADPEISHHYLHDEKTNEQNEPTDQYQVNDQNQLAEQYEVDDQSQLIEQYEMDYQNQPVGEYEVDDMSISSESNFEETLQNHFQYTPKSKSDGKIQKNGNSSVFISSIASNNNSKSNTISSREGNSSPNIAGNVDVNNCKSPISGGRKRRLSNGHFETSPTVEQFCKNSLVTSTPLYTKFDSARQRRLSMVNSAVRNKVRQSKQRTLLNLSVNSVDYMNIDSPITPKDEARRREQGAIAKHIARIRTSISRNDSSKENSPCISNSSRYYSMRTSFGSNDSSNFNKLSP